HDPEKWAPVFGKDHAPASSAANSRAAAYASPEARMTLVATGRFLSIFSQHRVSARSEIKALPVELPVDPVQGGIVTLKHRTLAPAAKLFVEHAREFAKSLAKKT